MKKIQVTFTENQMQLIRRYKGFYGATDAEVIRNLILTHPTVMDRISKKHIRGLK